MLRFYADFVDPRRGSGWLDVDPAQLDDTREEVPNDPGIYEWGAKVVDPGPRQGEVIVFYLGKAGESAGNPCRAFTTPCWAPCHHPSPLPAPTDSFLSLGCHAN